MCIFFYLKRPPNGMGGFPPISQNFQQIPPTKPPALDANQELWVETKTDDGKVFSSVSFYILAIIQNFYTSLWHDASTVCFKFIFFNIDFLNISTHSFSGFVVFIFY